MFAELKIVLLIPAILFAFVVIPVVGAACLYLSCKILQIPTRYVRCWKAYIVSILIAGLLSGVIFSLTVQDGQFPGYVFPLTFVLSILTHLVVVPIVLKIRWGKALLAHAMALGMFSVILGLATIPLILDLREKARVAKAAADDELARVNMANSVAALKELGATLYYEENDPNRSLESVAFPYSKATDADLRHIKDLKSVRKLFIVRSQVTSSGLRELRNLKNLEDLYLGGTKVTDEGMQELKELTSLQIVDLSYTEVTDVGLKELSDLKKLKKLNLAGTRITDAGLLELQHFANLQELDLANTKVTDVGMRELKDLKQLTTLRLSNTQITDATLATLTAERLHVLSIAQGKDGRRCSNPQEIASLNLGGTLITDAGLKELKQLQQLTRLDLSAKVMGPGLKELKDLKQLTRLGMSREQITDVALESLISNNLLHTVNVYSQYVHSGNLFLARGDDVAGQPGKKCMNLQEIAVLDLGNTAITDAGLKSLQELKDLNTLWLHDTQIGDAGLKELKELKRLRKLTLGKTKITDAGIADLKELKDLNYLSIDGTKLSETGKNELRVALPKCTFFDPR